MMKIKISSILLALSMLSIWLMPATVRAYNLTLEPTQGPVGTEVTIPATCTYGSGDYQLYWGEADNKLLDQGAIDDSCMSIIFTVPEATKGNHKVTLKIAGNSFDREFNVMPSITLSSEHGITDSDLTITGTGFNSNEPDIQITYDGNPATDAVKADSNGSWQHTLKVPNSTRGEHIIDAGGTTPASEVEDRIFTVTPKTSLSPTSGWVGTKVNIAGNGFAGGETNIVVTYDGMAAKTGVAADSQGSWETTFSIPTSSKGSHKVGVYGAVTPKTDTAEITFTVSPGIKLDLVTGHLGDSIYPGDNLWISGFGFEENEAGIKITFDGMLVASGFNADAQGSWTTRFEVPPSPGGEHAVNASGDTTQSGDIADALLVVSPAIDINSTSGAIGDEVTISGTGFGKSQTLNITYDGRQMVTDSTSDAKGDFTATFKIPESPAGNHTITVMDATASAVSASFTVESTPPATPQLLSPEAGSKVGFIGETIITFDWSDIDDPSGVHYLLEISESPDWTGSILRKESLTQSQYTLSENEALARGEYYWRVKAIDGAENQSAWSTEQLVKSGSMELWLLIVIILGVIGVTAIVWRVLSISRKGGWR